MIFREMFNLNTCNQSPPHNIFKTLTHLKAERTTFTVMTPQPTHTEEVQVKYIRTVFFSSPILRDDHAFQKVKIERRKIHLCVTYQEV